MGKNGHNYGIDVARISAIFFVFVLHNLKFGNLLTNSQITIGKWAAIWGLEAAAVIAVNVFALITGYLLTGGTYKGSRVIIVVMQTLFWSWFSILVIFKFIPYTNQMLLAFLFPFSRYWYVNAYVGMMLLVPFIDKGIQKLTRHQFFALLVILSIICTTAGFKGHLFLENGYSAYWLIVMYLVGAFIRRYPPQKIKSTSVWFLGYLGFTALSLVAVLVARFTKSNIAMVVAYDSPLVFLAAICFFIFCIKLNVRSHFARLFLRILSPASFGAYIIGRTLITSGQLARIGSLAKFDTPTLIVLVVVISVLMFLFAVVLDYGRIFIFQRLRITEFSEWLETKLKRVLYSLDRHLGSD